MAKSLFFDGFPEQPWYETPLKPVEQMEGDIELMLDAQRSLMQECGVQDIPNDIAFFLTIQSLIAEAGEAGIDFPNLSKPWKKELTVSLPDLQEEWIDVLHYWLQGAEILGLDANTINELYHRKNRKNFNRISQKLKAMAGT